MTSPTDSRYRQRRLGQPAKGDLRELALLDAAERLLTAGRFGSESVSDLAAAAGISRATFYFYFASKEALLARVVDRAVHGFNEQIASVLDTRDGVDGARALRESVEAAGDLWWQHSRVLMASVELGTRVPEIYEHTQKNLEIVRRPTVALLIREGRVPEAADPAQADELVLALTLLSERSFYHLMRADPTPDQLRSTVDRIASIWLRAFGLDESHS